MSDTTYSHFGLRTYDCAIVEAGFFFFLCFLLFVFLDGCRLWKIEMCFFFFLFFLFFFFMENRYFHQSHWSFGAHVARDSSLRKHSAFVPHQLVCVRGWKLSVPMMDETDVCRPSVRPTALPIFYVGYFSAQKYENRKWRKTSRPEAGYYSSTANAYPRQFSFGADALWICIRFAYIAYAD